LDSLLLAALLPIRRWVSYAFYKALSHGGNKKNQ
jgi:hypothetical protein